MPESLSFLHDGRYSASQNEAKKALGLDAAREELSQLLHPRQFHLAPNTDVSAVHVAV